MKLTVESINFGTAKQENKAVKAVNLLEKVFASDKFKRESPVQIPDGFRLFIQFYNNPHSQGAGTASPELKRVRLNTFYFDNFTVRDAAGTIAHEITHILGHKNESNPRSVAKLVKEIISEKSYQKGIERFLTSRNIAFAAISLLIITYLILR